MILLQVLLVGMCFHQHSTNGYVINVVALLPNITTHDPYSYKAALQMAEDMINSNSSFLTNYTIKINFMDTLDNMGNPVVTLFEAIHNLTPVMHAIIGPLDVTGIEQIMVYANVLKLQQVTFGLETNTIYNYQKDQHSSLHNRIAPQLNEFTNIKMKLLNHFKWKRAALLLEFEYSVSGDSIIEALTANNISLITKQDILRDKALLTQKISKLKDKDSRIILGEFNEKPANIMCQIYKQGLYAPRIVWILGKQLVDGWTNESSDCTREQLIKTADRHFAFDFVHIRRDNNKTDSGLTANEFLEKLKTDYNQTNPAPKSSYAFDALWLLGRAFQVASDHASFTPLEVYRYRDWRYNYYFSQLLRWLSFEGISGDVKFHGSYGFRDNDMLIYQYRTGKYIEVGYYDSRATNIKFYPEQENQLFEGTQVPKDKITVFRVYSSYNPAILITTGVITVCGILLALFFLFINIKYYNNKIIKMSSPLVNNFILFGSILCYGTIILNGLSQIIKDKKVILYLGNAAYATLGLGFTLTFGALFAKTWRVYKIFTASEKLKKVKKLTTSMFLILFSFVFIDMLLFGLWFTLSPMTIYEKEIATDENFVSDSITIKFIHEIKSKLGTEFSSAIFCFKGLLLVFGLFLAWQTKHVSIDILNDSKLIGFAVYNVSAISAIAVISAFALKDTANHQLIFIVTSLCIGICTTASLLLVFLPKVLILYSPDDGSQDARVKSRFAVSTGGSGGGTQSSKVTSESTHQNKDSKKNETSEAQRKRK